RFHALVCAACQCGTPCTLTFLRNTSLVRLPRDLRSDSLGRFASSAGRVVALRHVACCERRDRVSSTSAAATVTTWLTLSAAALVHAARAMRDATFYPCSARSTLPMPGVMRMRAGLNARAQLFEEQES